MSKRSILVLLAAILSLTAVPALALQGSQPEKAEQPSITVSNSPGAVTGNNNRVNIYQEARRDPVTQQFVVTLQRYTRTIAAGLQPNPEVPVYMFALEGTGQSRSSDETGEMYWIMVGDIDEDTAGVPVQECGDDFGLYGFIFSAARNSETGRLRMRSLVGQESSILNQLCRSLRQPLSALDGREAGPASSGTQVFDYLSRGNFGFGVILMPSRMMGQEIEEGLTRNLWAAAFALRYNRAPQPNFMTPELFGQLDRLESGEWIDAVLPTPPGFANPTSYSPQARREFGARLDRLDVDWIAYLRSAAVTTQNRQRRIWEGDHPAQFVPRFTLRDVGTPAFWRAANDLRDIMEQANCIAQHFLVDRQYLPPDETVAAGQCPLGEIRLPSP